MTAVDEWAAEYPTGLPLMPANLLSDAEWVEAVDRLDVADFDANDPTDLLEAIAGGCDGRTVLAWLRQHTPTPDVLDLSVEAVVAKARAMRARNPRR